jgi:hypothetical protein
MKTPTGRTLKNIKPIYSMAFVLFLSLFQLKELSGKLSWISPGFLESDDDSSWVESDESDCPPSVERRRALHEVKYEVH